jgi:hypothetical protein
MRWAGHVARMGLMRNAYKTLFRNSEGKKSVGRLGADGRILLEWILEK